MKNIVILGSTGSVGRNTVKVALALKDHVRVAGIAGNSQIQLLAEQAAQLGCSFAVTSDPNRLDELKSLLPPGCRAYAGASALKDCVCTPDIDLVFCSIVGTAGLEPVLAAIAAGKDIALASKEVLVMAGDLVMEKIKQKKVNLLPVDSEHSAIFQCLEGKREYVREIVLTASGGPFRTFPKEKLAEVTCSDAMKHPVWNMGAKVTLDSATLMNKALEMVEAHHLFQADESMIRVLVHPQSVVHSMVVFRDGAVLAHMSPPDMRFPIQYAMTWPGRLDGGLDPLNLTEYSGLTFENPDTERFPSLCYGREAIRRGGIAGAVMNAANEVAVDCFRKAELPFNGIYKVVEKTMEQLNEPGPVSLDRIFEADKLAREIAHKIAKGV